MGKEGRAVGHHEVLGEMMEMGVGLDGHIRWW